MANSYSPATVTPYIHKDLITEEEVETLNSVGISYELYGDEYYFYSEEGFMEEYDDAEDNTHSIWPILQAVIKRSKEFTPDVEVEYEEIEDIIIEGAYYCDKMRQGEFGGFVTRVTIDDVQGASTGDLVALLKSGEGVY